MLMTHSYFFRAEADYRLARAAALYQRGAGRRFHVPRRPSLRLPHPRRRPVQVA